MIVFLVLSLVVIVYITVKVTKMVWKAEKIIPVMLIFLDLSILSLILYFLMSIFNNIEYWPCNKNGSDNTQTIDSIYVLTSTLPSAFLAMAVTLNCNKWIYFTVRIRAFI
jgi:hypothetical protein